MLSWSTASLCSPTSGRIVVERGRTAVDAAVDRLLAPLRSRGGSGYLGEPVTQLEHALQSARLAAAEGGPDALVVAALLHDVGWLLADSAAGPDDHAARSAAYLAPSLPPGVTQPVRLHVEAKRWLCATSPDYRATLSEASKQTLALQGGPMDAGERGAFEADPWSSDAVRLRRWDDRAKVPGIVLADLDRWRPVVAGLLGSS
jgi:phosphonate degradation associated HDIG domain protein